MEDSGRHDRPPERHAPRAELTPSGDEPDRNPTHTPRTLDTDGYPRNSASYQVSEDKASSFDREEEEDEWEFLTAHSWRDDLQPQGGWMPDEALAAATAGTDGLEPTRREWQVNIRLDRERYAALKHAADAYGTAPTTLARMLVNRGARAVLAAYRAELAAFDWSDPQG